MRARVESERGLHEKLDELLVRDLVLGTLNEGEGEGGGETIRGLGMFKGVIMWGTE